MRFVDAVVDSIWFGRQIRSQESRVRLLHAKVLKATNCDPSLEREADRCLSKLQKLLRYAEDNSVMTQKDAEVAEKTLSRLQDIQRLLKEKRSWWEKLLDWVSQAIDVIKNILKFLAQSGYVLPLLPPALRESMLALMGAADVVVRLLPPSAD